MVPPAPALAEFPGNPAQNAIAEAIAFAIMIFLAVISHGHHFQNFGGSMYFRLTFWQNFRLPLCKHCTK